MQSTSMFWLWLLMFFPSCLCPDPKKLFDITKDVVFNEKIYLTNGRMSSLHDIFNFIPSIEFFDFYHNLLPEYFVYEDIAETEQHRLIERNPIGPNVENKLSGFEYIERTLMHRTIVDLITDEKYNYIFFFIAHAARDGVTVELAKIHEALIARDPALWTIPVDAMKHFKKLTATEITEQFLFDTVIDKKFKYLFTQLLKYNPKRIVLFFDNVEYMYLEKRNAVVSLINTLAHKGLYIVMMGQRYLLQQMSENEYLYPLYISDLWTTHQKQYLRNFWEKKMIPFKPKYNERLNEYIVAMVEVIRYRLFYYSFLPLEIFAEDFTRKQVILKHQPKNSLFDVGCLDYVIDNRRLPSKIYATLMDMKINRMDILDKLMNRLFQVESDYNIMEMKDAIYDYVAELALKHCTDPFIDNKTISDDRTPEIVQHIVKALGIVSYSYHGKSSSWSINIWYSNYFLATYIIKKLKFIDNYSVSNDMNITLNNYPSMCWLNGPVLELMDNRADQVYVPNLMAFMNPNDVLKMGILDEFIIYRASNLFDLVAMQLIDDPNTVKVFVNYIQRENVCMIGTLNKHESCNRIDTLIEKNMIQLSPWIEKFPFHYLSEIYRVKMFGALIRNVATSEDVMMLKKILNDKFLNKMSDSMLSSMAVRIIYLNTNVDELVYREFENIANFLRGKVTNIGIDNRVSSKSEDASSTTRSSTELEKIKEYKNMIVSVNNVDDIHKLQELLNHIDISYYYIIGDMLEAQLHKSVAVPKIQEREIFLKEATTLVKTLKSPTVSSKKWFNVMKGWLNIP